MAKAQTSANDIALGEPPEANPPNAQAYLVERTTLDRDDPSNSPRAATDLNFANLFDSSSEATPTRIEVWIEVLRCNLTAESDSDEVRHEL